MDFKVVVLGLVFSWLTPVAQARLAVPSDLASVNELERADILVDARGHSRSTIERLVRVNNDEGRDRESVQTIDFNGRAAHVKVIKAETINGGKISKVASSNIEIKAVGDFARSFDVQKRAKITFPDVKVGSKVHLIYVIDVDEVPNEGFWSFLADFNWWYMEHYEANIRSVLPLYTWKNDPHDLFEFSPSEDGKYHRLSIRTKGPIALQTTQEENPFIRSERSSTFVVSTLEDWSKYASATITNQDKLLAQPLPLSLQKIRDEAAKETTTVAKLDHVAAAIGENFRYFGDWRRRDGGFVPRPLKEIDETRYGDCKDLSLVATSIYRALGLKADLVWTLRGEEHLKPAKGWFKLPVDWFNHAVTRVEADGKVYWIDATNPVSYAKSIPADISGKPAFVLRSGAPFLEFIPELEASSATSSRSFVYAYQPNQTMKTTGDLTLKGRAAISLAVSAFYKPHETVDYELIHSLSYGYKILDSSVGEFPHASRIVSDVSIPFKFTLGNVGVRTSAGVGFLMSREGAVDRLLEETKDRASDLSVGESPGVWNTEEEITGVKRVGDQTLDCDLKSEWANLERKVTATAKGVKITDRMEIVKSVIPNEALQTTEFSKFQENLRECFFRAVLILKPVN